MKRLLFSTLLAFVSCLSATQFFAVDGDVKDDFETCILCTPSERYEATIAYTKHWKITYWSNQAYLGRSLITSQRHFGTFEEMTEEELIEFQAIMKIYLPTLKKVLGSTHFNVSYLMNQAYRNDPYDPHFHWHIIPRYDGDRTFGGETFIDPDFGNAYDFSRKQYLEGEFQKELIAALQKELNVCFVPVTSIHCE